MIYSFSSEMKCEWFPSDHYPPEDESTNTKRLPGGPRNKYRWFDGFVKGFPIGTELNELIQFDLESFLNHDVDHFSAVVNCDIWQWDEQECIRLEELQKGAFLHNGLNSKQLDLLRWCFSAIENRLIAESSFRGDDQPTDLSLWLLSQLDYYRTGRNPKRQKAMVGKNVALFNELMSFIRNFSSLPRPLQTAEYFRNYCERELGIVFRSYSPPRFEKVLIALFETALNILRNDTLLRGSACLVTNGIDLDAWIDERTINLIQLCASRSSAGGGISLYRLCGKHREIVRQFSELVKILKAEDLLPEEIKWYIDQAVFLSKTIDSAYSELMNLQRTNQFRSGLLFSRDIEKHGIEILSDFRIDSAIATSRILTNTFSALHLQELIALMTYAAIKQGRILHICPQCSLPFIKMDNRQEYCTHHCRTEHTKANEGKRAPSKIRQNLECKAWHNPSSQTKPKPYSNYFKQLLDVLKHYWKQYQSDVNVDAETYRSWVGAFNVVKRAHLTEKTGCIKCLYKGDLCNPLFPLIMGNRLVAISYPVSIRGKSNLLDAIESLEKGVPDQNLKVWSLSILKNAKGREVFPLNELIQLEVPAERAIPQKVSREQ